MWQQHTNMRNTKVSRNLEYYFILYTIFEKLSKSKISSKSNKNIYYLILKKCSTFSPLFLHWFMSTAVWGIFSDLNQTESYNTLQHFYLFTGLHIIYSFTFSIIKCGLKVLSEILPWRYFTTSMFKQENCSGHFFCH